MSTLARYLDQAVRVVCPIHGVSIGAPTDKATWKCHPTEAATQQQKDAAQAVIDAFDAAAHPSVDEKEAEALAALNGGAPTMDLLKLLKAKAISDEAYRLGKAPGALTGPELTAMRNRIAAIYKVL